MSGKLIHNLKRKRDEENASNSSKNSSPAGSPLTLISQSSQNSLIVNPSSSTHSTPSSSSSSSYSFNGCTSKNLLSEKEEKNETFPELNNKPGPSSSSKLSSSVERAASCSGKNEDPSDDVKQDAKHEKHDFYVDTPESSNDGTEGLLPPTPPSEFDDLPPHLQQQHNPYQQINEFIPTSKDTFLVEALKRIVELQHELEELEKGQSEEDDHEVSNIIEHHRHNLHYQQQQQQLQQQQNYGAEALGFAMCARETLLFLQREGVPENSELYRALRDKLVGKSPQRIPT